MQKPKKREREETRPYLEHQEIQRTGRMKLKIRLKNATESDRGVTYN